MIRGLLVDDNLSILNEPDSPYNPQLSSASTSTNQPPQKKKKRNLPGNPDPEAEVIALSPKSLLATNRFICEICKKGFQRDQNLQLHRRGHNLPWKLKQRGSNELVRKKVYVCPEATCVHHHPTRALGDLTGIKKHFCRKHGEKKWKCDKCEKHYAVQSDWKAHSKVCGTREYRCDCGTIFSRRDSFITHRAFCDALAHQSTAVPSSAIAAMNPLLHNAAFRPLPAKTEESQLFTITSQVPSWLAPQTPSMADSGSCIHNIPQNPNPTSAVSMSAAGMLQMVGQVGSSGDSSFKAHVARNSAIDGLLGSVSTPLFASCPVWESPSPVETAVNSGFNGKTSSDQSTETPRPHPHPHPQAVFHHMMTFEEASFEEALNGIFGKSAGAGDGETRDFLGLRGLASTDQVLSSEMNLDSSSSAFGVQQTTFWRDLLNK